MAWAEELHVRSGERHSAYYLSVPDAWSELPPADLKAKVMGVFQAIYYSFNEHFREAEPNDLSYLAPLDANPRFLAPEEEKIEPWLKAKVPAVWEWTPCVVVGEDGRYTKVEPPGF